MRTMAKGIIGLGFVSQLAKQPLPSFHLSLCTWTDRLDDPVWIRPVALQLPDLPSTFCPAVPGFKVLKKVSEEKEQASRAYLDFELIAKILQEVAQSLDKNASVLGIYKQRSLLLLKKSSTSRFHREILVLPFPTFWPFQCPCFP